MYSIGYSVIVITEKLCIMHNVKLLSRSYNCVITFIIIIDIGTRHNDNDEILDNESFKLCNNLLANTCTGLDNIVHEVWWAWPFWFWKF